MIDVSIKLKHKGERNKVETQTEILECGCVREFVADKWFLIEECEDHDLELNPPQQKPHIKKFRKSVMDYV